MTNSNNNTAGVLLNATSVSRFVYMENSDGSPATGLLAADIAFASATPTWAIINPIVLVDLNLLTDAFTANSGSCGWLEVHPSYAPGWYRLDIPDAVWASGTDQVVIAVTGTAGAHGRDVVAMVNTPPDTNLAYYGLQNSTRYPITMDGNNLLSVNASDIGGTTVYMQNGLPAVAAYLAGWSTGNEGPPAVVVAGYVVGQKGNDGVFGLVYTSTAVDNDGPYTPECGQDDIGSLLYVPGFGTRRIIAAYPYVDGNFGVVILDYPFSQNIAAYDPPFMIIPATDVSVATIGNVPLAGGTVYSDDGDGNLVMTYYGNGGIIGVDDVGGTLWIQGQGTRTVTGANPGEYAVTIDAPFSTNVADAYFTFLPGRRPDAATPVDSNVVAWLDEEVTQDSSDNPLVSANMLGWGPVSEPPTATVVYGYMTYSKGNDGTYAIGITAQQRNNGGTSTPLLTSDDVGSILYVPGYGSKRIMAVYGSWGNNSVIGLDSAFETDVAVYNTAFVIIPSTAMLPATALNNIDMTPPSGQASNFRELLIAIWRRFFKQVIRTQETITTYADDNETTVTSQAIEDDGTTQTQGSAG